MAKRQDKLQIILDNYVTKRHLEEVLEKKNYVTRDYLDEMLEKKNYVTKDYLDEVLDKKLDEKIGKAMLEQRLEYQRQTGALYEDFGEKVKSLVEGINTALAMFSRESEVNKGEHEAFDGRLHRLEARMF